MFTTDCGESFLFEDGGPISNGLKFCPYCGARLAQLTLHWDGDDLTYGEPELAGCEK